MLSKLNILGMTIILTFLAGGLFISGHPYTSTENKILNESQPFVVVELFTSQGCYSCPAADDNLRALTKEYADKDVTLIPLAFHVDYWNYLGWKDIYSDKRFSLRQRTYASKLNSGVYTPQMVFNGSSECVGSRTAQTRELIRKGAQVSPDISIDLRPTVYTHQENWEINIQITGTHIGQTLYTAVTEEGLEVPIARGENGGKTLKYDHVVRTFEMQSLDGTKEQIKVKLLLPEDLNPSKSHLVAFIQDDATGKIISAQKTAVLP
ncbi:MAG: DUF1223 domain-containing protein [Bacteroidota bacterium]